MIRKKHQPDYLDKVKTFMESNYRNALNVQQLAILAGVSLRTLQSTFHSFYGVTMQVFHLELRINKAKDLLTDTNKSIKEIASHVGYHDSSTFDHFFRHVTGINPEQYRKENT
jgi:AraC family transcriptional regulator of arabinose operon